MSQAIVQLVDQPIDWPALQHHLDDPDSGAQGWFLGVTRRTTGTRVTQTLFYEAHRPMAISELKTLAEQATERFSLKSIIIVHRLGEVPIGQASIAVGCCSAHRVDTFDALRWVMDQVKQHVPIWKRELYADGTTEWVHPTP